MNKKTILFLTMAVVLGLLVSAFAWADSVGDCTVTSKAGKKQQMTMYTGPDLRRAI
ncbi:hypothetical protein KKA47_06235 [bacterium]|nr:hypothetical protein [bacterium]